MSTFRPLQYRYPYEHTLLALTISLVLLVIIVTATATFCGSVVFVALMLVFAYFSTRSQHQSLLQTAYTVTPASAPGLWSIARSANQRLDAGPMHIFVVPRAGLNAYTFGLSAPKVAVITAGLVNALEPDELGFVIGHELGHVALGHTWLNSLVGGLAGIPSPSAAFALLRLAFLWWNRSCEYSADRAGLLATGQHHAAMSALLKVGGLAGHSAAEIEQALQSVLAHQADPADLLGEALATHPLIARRLAHLRDYAASPDYRRLTQP